MISASLIENSITDYIELIKLLTYTSSYQSLHTSVDQTNSINLKRSGEFGLISNELSNKLSFYHSTFIVSADEFSISVFIILVY